jgi:hypothetical protein
MYSPAYARQTPPAGKTPLQFTVKAPPGFEIDNTEQETIIDIIIDGKKIAETPVKFDHEIIRFSDPEGLSTLISNIREHAVIVKALSKPMAQNRDLACSQTDPKPYCGYMQPDIAGVIFHPDTLAAHLFISELYTYSRDSRARYLPPPTKGAGLITGINVRGFYDFNSKRTTLNSNFNLITGYGRTHFRADLFANSKGGASLRSANLNYTGRTHEASAGFLPYRSGSTLARSDRLAGIRFASTLKTRLDRTSLRAADIPILVTSSARVEITRNGKLIDIQRVEPGQTALDISRFPGGSYEIVLHINEGGAVREETRFFTSGAQLPPSGAPQWYIEIGLPTQNSSQGNLFPNLNQDPVFNAGYSKRLHASFGIEGKVSLSEQDQYAETSLYIVGANYNLSGGIIGSTDGDYGGYIQTSYRKSKWQISGNYRDIRAANATGILLNGRYDPFPQGFRQAGINTSYRFENGRVGMRGFYRQTGTRADTYFGGPFAEYNILKTKRSRLTLNTSYETGNIRSSYFVGLRLSSRLKASNSRQNLSLNAQTNIRRDIQKASGTVTNREIAEATLRLTTTPTNGQAFEYFVGTRYEDNVLGAKAGLRARRSYGNLGLEIRKNYQRQSNLYADLTTGFAVGNGRIAPISQFSESGAFVNIDGNSPAQFSVISGATRKVRASHNHTAFIPLTTFDIHDIAIKPADASDVDYDSHTERLVLYPGNLPAMHRTARTVTIMVGRIVGQDTHPLTLATIGSTKPLAVTDEGGYFQLDYSGEETLNLRKKGKEICQIDMTSNISKAVAQSTFVDVGVLICE